MLLSCVALKKLEGFFMASDSPLHRIMRRHGLDCATVGRLTGYAAQTVRAWRCGARKMPESAMRLLRFELGV